MDALKVSVEDTGIGISEEDSKKLFEPFTQVDEAEPKVWRHGAGVTN